MLAHEIMVSPVITITPDTTLADAAELMLKHHVGGLPVVDDKGHICGMLTDSDFAAHQCGVPGVACSILMLPQVLGEWLPKDGVEKIYGAAQTIRAKEVMSTNIVVSSENERLEEIIERMLHKEVRHVPVVRKNVPVGIITRRDLLKLMLKRQ